MCIRYADVLTIVVKTPGIRESCYPWVWLAQRAEVWFLAQTSSFLKIDGEKNYYWNAKSIQPDDSERFTLFIRQKIIIFPTCFFTVLAMFPSWISAWTWSLLQETNDTSGVAARLEWILCEPKKKRAESLFSFAASFFSGVNKVFPSVQCSCAPFWTRSRRWRKRKNMLTFDFFPPFFVSLWVWLENWWKYGELVDTVHCRGVWTSLVCEHGNWIIFFSVHLLTRLPHRFFHDFLVFLDTPDGSSSSRSWIHDSQGSLRTLGKRLTCRGSLQRRRELGAVGKPLGRRVASEISDFGGTRWRRDSEKAHALRYRSKNRCFTPGLFILCQKNIAWIEKNEINNEKILIFSELFRPWFRRVFLQLGRRRRRQ